MSRAAGEEDDGVLGDQSPDAAREELSLGVRLPLWRRTQPLGLWWVLPLGLAASLWVLLEGWLRGAGYSMAATLAAAALLRLLLPRDAVGGLMVRSRAFDVVTLLALSAAMVVISATLVIR